MKINLTKLLEISHRVVRLNRSETDAATTNLYDHTSPERPYSFELIEDAEGE